MSQLLDLDVLEPKTGSVKLGGKTYPVSAPPMKTIISISKIYNQLKTKTDSADFTDDEITETLNALQEALIPIIPDLGKDDVSLTFPQAIALINYVTGLSQPDNLSTVQKKMEAPEIQPVS